MRERAGQITIEYFLLLAAIILVSVIGLSTFHTDIAATFQNLFSSAAQHMPLDDVGPPLPPDVGGAGTDPGDFTPPENPTP